MMRHLKFLVTAGPTREPIDPVRFISNRSSGKMGYAIARAIYEAGHTAFLISGPVALTSPKGVRPIFVETAEEMRRAVTKHARKSTIIIMTAAVADYRPKKFQRQKIKKLKSKTGLTLQLEKTKDILKELGLQKSKNQLLIGFAAETRNLLAYAQEKLLSKNLDLIIANKVGKKGIGFDSDSNQITLIERSGKIHRWPKMKKEALGKKIVRFILTLHRKRETE
jgi:phosphopantothenoylcysteine decarboxylase/phosphopantothenate--cysteine ligase